MVVKKRVAKKKAPQALRLGLPKGSLQESTLQLFAKAGYIIALGSRSYKPSVDDPNLDIRLIRAQEISRYVEHGFLDVGITGRDWILENESKVEVICDIPFSKATAAPARWVLAVPENSPIRSVRDLRGKRIATEAVNLTRQYLKKNRISAEVEFSWGATEVKVPELVDAIVEITETGSSLRANQLRIVDTLIASYPQLIANKKSWKDAKKRALIENLTLLLQSAIQARNKVGLKMNIPQKFLPKLLEQLPSLRNPTVSPLANNGWVAVETVIDEITVRKILPQLKALGAEGIIEYPLNKLVY